MNRLVSYLRNPIYCENQKPTISYLLSLIIVYFISLIPIEILVLIVCKYFHVEHKELFLNPFETIIWGLFLVPVYEEILFRSLLKFTKWNILMFIITVSALICYTVLSLKTEFALVLSIMLLCLFFFLRIVSRSKIEFYISSNFKYFFYASALIFGLIHASNFNGNIYTIIAFSFILGGPQIIAGLLLGFVRMNFGLSYSIIFHLIINSTLLFSFI